MIEKNIPYDTLVIGGGQAGLAAGYYLQRAGSRFLIVEAHDRIGDNWRRRWEGLQLFSPQRYNALPGLPPPGTDLQLPSKDEIADYLENYSIHFKLPVRTATQVTRVTPIKDGFRVALGDKTVVTHSIIVASGAYRTPHIPSTIAVTFPDSVRQVHSSEVSSVEDLVDADTSVLIVGAGASGQQLANRAVHAGAKVTLAGGDVTNLPRSILGKDIYWWLYNSGLMTVRTDRFPGSLLVGSMGDVTVAEPPLHDGIARIKTRLSHYKDGALVFSCNKTAPDPLPWPERQRGLIIWCTGFRNEYPWLPAEFLCADGTPKHSGGHSTVNDRLFFLGLPNLRKPNSSLVGGVGKDAAAIVKRIST